MHARHSVVVRRPCMLPRPHAAITEALESTKEAAKDATVIKDILAAASDRAMLKNVAPGEGRVRRRLPFGGPAGAGPPHALPAVPLLAAAASQPLLISHASEQSRPTHPLCCSPPPRAL